MIGWLRSLLDKGEAKEREQVKQQVNEAMTEAQTEIQKARTALKRANLELDARRRSR